jgi:DMSO reductase anchor subunit
MSGAGYGLWILMALASLLIWPEHPPGNGMAEVAWPNLLPCALAAGFLLVSCGLVSSLGHLGQPQRAWRALSQWRTSWLSREGIAAILTYLPVIGIGSAIFHDGRMPVDAMTGGDPLAALWMSSEMRTVASILLLAGSVATILCTANIYACLKPVRAWQTAMWWRIPADRNLQWGPPRWALAALPQGQIVDLRVLPVFVAVFAFATALLKASLLALHRPRSGIKHR